MRNNILLFTVILGLLFCTSCDKTDLTPSYIEINKEDVTLNMYNFNTIHNTNFDEFELAAIADQDFADIWITADGVNLGTWELPCKLPLLDQDTVSLSMVPGVLMNGMSTTRPKYPFVQYCKTKYFFEKEETTHVKVNVKYYDNVHFPLIETFEGAGYQFFKSDSSKVGFTRTSDPELVYHNPLNPNALNFSSGMIVLSDSIMSFEVESGELQLPGSGYPVFLEMNYKCDKEMYVGLLVHSSTTSYITDEPLVNIRPSKEWKKIYINLTQCISRNTTANAFQVNISGVKDEVEEEAHFYFDNIKVVYIY